MIWIILFTIGGVIFAISSSLEMADSIPGAILFGLFIVPLGTIIGVLLGFLVALLFGAFGSLFVDTEDVVIRDEAIYSLNDSTAVNGHFTLGTGYVDEDLCIYYVTEEDSIKQIQRVKRSQARIIESDTDEPHVVVTEQRYKHKWVEWFMIDILSGLNRTATLTVPVGTVTTQYNIDLE